MDTAVVNALTWKIPNALALVGSRAGDEWNAMTTSWITQLSMEPVLIGVGVDNTAVTHGLITRGGAFTVNLWSADDTKTFVKFSKPATRSEDDGRRSTAGRSPRPRQEPRCSTKPSPGWTAPCATHSTSAPTRCSSASSTAGAVNDDDARVAAMSDTRMKYGGVKRH